MTKEDWKLLAQKARTLTEEDWKRIREEAEAWARAFDEQTKKMERLTEGDRRVKVR